MLPSVLCPLRCSPRVNGSSGKVLLGLIREPIVVPLRDYRGAGMAWCSASPAASFACPQVPAPVPVCFIQATFSSVASWESFVPSSFGAGTSGLRQCQHLLLSQAGLVGQRGQGPVACAERPEPRVSLAARRADSNERHLCKLMRRWIASWDLLDSR